MNSYQRLKTKYEKAKQELDLFKKALTIFETKPEFVEKKDENGDIQYCLNKSYEILRNDLDRKCQIELTKWVIDNIDKETIKKWFGFESNKYEEWEDLYGIEILTLLKSDEVYYRYKWSDGSGYSDIMKSFNCYIDIHNHQLIAYDNEYDEFGTPLPFEEYGETWALTKEELE